MPKMLIDGAVEYEDGTPATEAQVLFIESLIYYIACCHRHYDFLFSFIIKTFSMKEDCPFSPMTSRKK